MAEKIPCGGFYIDDNTLSIQNNVLKVVNSSSSGSTLICTMDSQTEALNKTWQEVNDFAQTGIVVLTYEEEGTNYAYLTSVTSKNHEYILVFDDHGTNLQLVANSPNDYPIFDDK